MLSNDPLDLQCYVQYKIVVRLVKILPDAVETLDTDRVLLDGGVSHGDSPGENLSDVTVQIRSTQSSLLLVVVVQPHWPQLVRPVLDCVQGLIV